MENSLHQVSNVFDHYRHLEEGGDLFIISSSLENIIQNSFNIPGFKNNLQLILSNLVEALWQAHSSQYPPSLVASLSLTCTDPFLQKSKKKITPKPHRSPPLSSTPNLCKSNGFANSPIPSKSTGFANSPKLYKSNGFANTVRIEDLHLISEFSYSKGHTFTKEKRMNENKDRVPGPADYDKNSNVCLSSSPKITMTKSPRIIKFTNSTTPAPGQYNPIKYFTSR